MTYLCKVCGEPIRAKSFVRLVFEDGHKDSYHWGCFLSLKRDVRRLELRRMKEAETE